MRDYEPYYTQDGSIGLYSFADKDVYHSKFGALTEAWEKFILPSQISDLLDSKKEINVLDICYGIGYNTKALMTYVINSNKNKLQKQSLLSKLKKIIEKIFLSLLLNIVSICNNNNLKKTKDLLLHIVTKYADKNIGFILPDVNIDCLDINEELVKLSPFFKTIKTPEEIYSQIIPDFFSRFKLYYIVQSLFVNIISIFYPKNRKEICDLLDIKFKNMHLDKEYKVNEFVNYILINSLSQKYGNDYIDVDINKNISDRNIKNYLAKKYINYAKFNQYYGYNLSSKHNLTDFLHNIYYSYLSKRNKNIDFKTAESLFNLSFYIGDARKSILQINKRYDCIYLDAFTYTKCAQLWSFEFIAELVKKMSNTGVILTYSNSAQIRNTFIENGLFVGKIFNDKSNKFNGTIASKDKSKIKYPLNNFEIGLCATKAGIPYHDPNLSFSNKEILELREYEFKNSNLMSSSKYMKIRTLRSFNEK